MQEMLMAIWHQNFDQLIQLGKVDLLIWCLVLILFLESAFVFLPLPGDSLVLMAGGLLAAGVVQPEVVYVYMPLAAGLAGGAGSAARRSNGHCGRTVSIAGSTTR